MWSRAQRVNSLEVQGTTDCAGIKITACVFKSLEHIFLSYDAVFFSVVNEWFLPPAFDFSMAMQALRLLLCK